MTSEFPRVLVTRNIPAPGLDRLERAGASIVVAQRDDEAGVPRTVLLDGVAKCDVLLPLLTEAIDAEVLSVNPRLLGVANMAVGYNNIDVEAATELGIPVANTPGVLTDSTADLTWALILATTRRVAQAHAYMTAGRYKIWGPNLLLGADVGRGGSGEPKTLGVVGHGRIGQAVIRRAIGFDMEILAHDPYDRSGIDASSAATWADLPDLLARSDIVTLHPPLTEETRHLIGERELRTMRRTAYLINAARGPIVDERTLVRALREGWIAGAGLDVYEHEPEMAPGLAECPNAVLLPHIASATHDTRGRMATMAAENALAHANRTPAPNVVNPEVYHTDAYRIRIDPVAG